MARYFLHLRDHIDELIDAEGIDLPDMESLKKAVFAAARDIMCGDIKNGMVDLRYRIDAEDGDGKTVFTLPFKHAVNVIPERV